MREERLARIRRLRGIDYVPSYARGPQDSLGSLCRRDVLTRELGFSRGLGLNGVRLWLHIGSYEEDPALYLDNLVYFLDRCQEEGLGAHLNLFDSVGVDPEDAAKPATTKQELRQRFVGNPFVDQMIQIVGDRHDLMLVPDCEAPVALLTEFWIAGPGYVHVQPDEWQRCESYVRAVSERVRSHPALLILEVMNEPEACLFGREVDYEPVRRFYSAMHAVLADTAPDVPTTIGSSNLEAFKQADIDTGMRMDVVSFHCFARDSETFRAAWEEAKAYTEATGNRPVICSEWGIYPGDVDEAQLAAYKMQLPIALDSGIAWETIHTVAGYCNGADAALLYANGTMRPAGVYLRQTMREFTP